MTWRRSGTALYLADIPTATYVQIVTAAANVRGVRIHSGWVKASGSGYANRGGLSVNVGATFFVGSHSDVVYDIKELFIPAGTVIDALLATAAVGILSVFLDYTVLS